MFNYIMFFWLCSVNVTQCQPIATPKQLFIDHYDCVAYGYRHSVYLLEKKIKREKVNKLSLFTRFSCNKKKKDIKKGKGV